jgi:DNA polymerase III subunit gamma/tau
VTRPAQVAPPQSAPATPASPQRMQPGPAFSASVPASGAEAPAAPPPAPSVMPPAPAAEQAPRVDAAIAPAPTAIELDLPAALPGDSIAAAVDKGRDSLALKRILKAVSGSKANPAAP